MENKTNEDKKRIKGNEATEFIIGIMLLGLGLFMLAMKVRVYTGFFGYGFRIWNFNIPSGTVVLPLIIGVIWYVINPKSILSKIVMILGGIFIVASIIMSVSLSFTGATLFEYILMLLLSAVGLGLILKTSFTDKKEEN